MLHADAKPRKEFFITMLVRDVPLTRAILDLVDNSVDAAHSLHVDPRSAHIEIEVRPEQFLIRDNCGGMSIDTAKNYAFRFGRSSKATPESNSIGLFGVGMKRTIFKLGAWFEVHSETAAEAFSITQDVREWLRDEDNWTFDIVEGAGEVLEQHGTQIRVTELDEQVARSFGSDSFIAELTIAIQDAHCIALRDGIRISLNGRNLTGTDFGLLVSDRIKPARKVVEIETPENGRVTVDLVAGVTSASERNFHKGGWYVFCNGRQVIGADKSTVTGWGLTEDDVSHPRYRADFAYFRGFAHFSSEDPRLLPWTTTKTGLDEDSRVFRIARREMQVLMRPITAFLTELAADKAADQEEGGPSPDSLSSLMDATSLQSYASAVPQGDVTFEAPPKRTRVRRAVVSIQFTRPRDLVEKAQKIAKVSTATQLGEAVFDYFFRSECE